MVDESFSEERLKKLESLDDDVAKDAAEFIRSILNSPFYDGYLAVKNTIDNLNNELQDGASKIVSDSDEKNDKQFERCHKYITEMKPYYEQLEYFRSKLSPQEVEDLRNKTIVTHKELKKFAFAKENT